MIFLYIWQIKRTQDGWKIEKEKFVIIKETSKQFKCRNFRFEWSETVKKEALDCVTSGTYSFEHLKYISLEDNDEAARTALIEAAKSRENQNIERIKQELNQYQENLDSLLKLKSEGVPITEVDD